MELTLIMKG